MSTITKLRFVPLTIAPEPLPEQNIKPQTAQSSAGIANVPDGFESAKPSNSEIFTIAQPQTQSNLVTAPVDQNTEETAMEKMERALQNINRLFSNLNDKLTSSLK